MKSYEAELGAEALAREAAGHQLPAGVSKLSVGHLVLESEHGAAALSSEAVVLDGVHDVLIPPAVVRDAVPVEREGGGMRVKVRASVGAGVKENGSGKEKGRSRDGREQARGWGLRDMPSPHTK